jgi:peptide/nickel transport system substrate-binding protein
LYNRVKAPQVIKNNEEINMMKLGYRIYAQMKELRLTQAQLAEKSGLSQQIISNYINNKFKPGYDAILALSKALEVNPAWFFDEAAVPTGDIIVFGKAQRGGTLKIGHLLPMDNLPLPVSLSKATGIVMNLYWLMFDTLVRGFHYREPKAGMAYNWKQGGNYWIFDLFENITFHNGQSCTAYDVEYSYQKWMSRNKDDNPIKTAQAIDAHTFLLELKEDRKLVEIPMPFIVPKGGRVEAYKFVGTGPFKAVSIQPDVWRLQTHTSYYHGRPFFDEVIIKRYQNPKELENALINEQVHLALGIDLRDERFNVQTEADVQRYELVFRLDSPLCSDIRFRQAVYYGLDRTAIAKASGLRNPLFAKGTFDYVMGERSELPEEPDRPKAKQLLSEIPNISETHLSFEIFSVDSKNETIVNEIITQLNALGIQTEIVQHKAQAAVFLMNTTTPYLERQIWKKGGIANVAGYHNPCVEKMLDNLSDVSINTTLLKQIQALIKEDYPSVPLFYNEVPVTYVRKLRALEDRMILMTMLSDIHTWYFESETEIAQFPQRIKLEREAATSLPG